MISKQNNPDLSKIEARLYNLDQFIQWVDKRSLDAASPRDLILQNQLSVKLRNEYASLVQVQANMKQRIAAADGGKGRE